MMNKYSGEYHTSFMAGLMHYHIERVYSRDLPSLLKIVKDLTNHPLSQEFITIINIEYEALWDRGTFKKSLITGIDLFILPLMWVFTYKLDEDGYLLKVKARLIVHGDL